MIYHVRISVFLLLLIFSSACSNLAPEGATPTPSSLPTLEPVDSPISAWGQVEVIAQAETRDAPAFFTIPDGSMVFAWTGSQESEARHYSRGVNGNGQIMSFKAFFPFQQELSSNSDGIIMFWLDRTIEDENLRLLIGSFSHDGVALLGPAEISNLRTQRYSIAKHSDNFIYAVWSGGLGSVSNLHLQLIDSFLRPIGSQDLRVDADYPALLKIEDELYLFWLEDNGRDVYVGRFEEESLIDIRRIARTGIDGTIAIEHFSAAFDGEMVYLFWNLRLSDGSRQVLWSTGRAESGDFGEAVPLGISAAGDIGFETPYALADVHGAELSETNIAAWANPVSNAEEMLPVAVNLGGELGVAFFQEGELVAYQSVVQTGELIGLPNIQIINHSHLALSWAQASTTRPYANLFFTRTEVSR